MEDKKQHEEETTQSFKVMDRRRIDEHGDDRKESQPQTASVTNSPEPIQPEPVRSAIASSDQVEVHENTGEVTFSSFIVSLATQALMQLGQIAPPPGVDLAIDKEAARQTIDIIALLHKKTQGNLDSEEKHLIDEILNSLRFQFVQKATNK